MNHFNPRSEIPARVLATDLDGTLIPLPDQPANLEALKTLCLAREDGGLEIVFATGRHFESVAEAIDSFGLPEPDWIVCDVGSAIYHRVDGRYAPYTAYEEHLEQRCAGVNREAIESLLAPVVGLKPQPPAHQQRFKISYESSAARVDDLVIEINQRLKAAKLPYNCMGSVDPFAHCGLLDVMPASVSKAYALLWLSTHGDFEPDEVVYAGDSGNDFAALVSGFRAIVVANASTGLGAKVRDALAARSLEDRLFCAREQATSGVLEGCRHFGLMDH